MTLREIRKKARLTQARAAEILGVSLRSYKSYETDSAKEETLKYRYMSEKLAEATRIDSGHGLLTQEDIKNACSRVLSEYPVKWCYLFGSYANGTADERSDVDLAVSGGVDGLRFYGMVEAIKDALGKDVDVLAPEQLCANPLLLSEVLRYGVKVYEKREG